MNEADANLIKPAPPKKELPKIGGGLGAVTMQRFVKEVRAHRLKQTVLTVLLIVASAAAGWTISRFLNESPTLQNWLFIGGAFIVYLAIFSICALVLSWKTIAPTAAIGSFAILFPQWGVSLSAPNLILLVLISAFFHLIASLAMRHRAQDSLKFHFGSSLGAGLGHLITGFTIVFLLIYYFSFSSGGTPRFFIGENTVAQAFDSSRYFGPVADLGIRRDMTVDDAINILLKANRDKTIQALVEKQPNVKNLPEPEFNRVVGELEKQTLVALRKEISQKLGANLTGQETVTAVISHYLETMYQQLPSHTQGMILGGWLVILFLSIRSFGFIIGWLVTLASWIFLQFFLTTRILAIQREPAERQTIVIP